jgi:uncharacterized protein (DUF1778 family)
MTKSTQLQIRVSPQEKTTIQQAARKAGLDMSEYVLSRLFPPQKKILRDLVRSLGSGEKPSYVLASLHDLLEKMGPAEFQDLFAESCVDRLPPYLQNYLAAMLEQAAIRKRIDSPQWLNDIPVLDKPAFGTELQSLRLHVLIHSPLAFRRRNIFVDASIGDRI